MRMGKGIGLLAAGIVAMTWVSSAMATSYGSLGTVSVKYVSCSPKWTAIATLSGVTSPVVDVGQYNLQLQDAYNPQTHQGYQYTGEGIEIYASAPSRVVGTFCSDFYQGVPPKSTFTEYNVYVPEEAPVGGRNNPNGMGEQKAWDLRRLYDQHSYQATLSTDGAAAFEACIWEIVYETSGTYNVSDTALAGGLRVANPDRGNFFLQPKGWSLSGDKYRWVDLANSWLQNLGTEKPADIGLRILASENFQDFALIVPGEGSLPIPEPLTMLGLAAGVMGTAGYLRRNRISSQIA